MTGGNPELVLVKRTRSRLSRHLANPLCDLSMKCGAQGRRMFLARGLFASGKSSYFSIRRTTFARPRKAAEPNHLSAAPTNVSCSGRCCRAKPGEPDRTLLSSRNNNTESNRRRKIDEYGVTHFARRLDPHGSLVCRSCPRSWNICPWHFIATLQMPLSRRLVARRCSCVKSRLSPIAQHREPLERTSAARIHDARLNGARRQCYDSSFRGRSRSHCLLRR